MVQLLQDRIAEDISKIHYDTNTLEIILLMYVICADRFSLLSLTGNGTEEFCFVYLPYSSFSV